MPSTKREPGGTADALAQGQARDAVPQGIEPQNVPQNVVDDAGRRRDAACHEDAACVARALAGDRSAFEEIYERHRQAVFKVAFGIVRNVEDALDVVQETFLKAYRCLGRFERRSSLLTWLCQIAVHRAIDVTRRKKVRKAAELEEFMLGAHASGSGTGLARDGGVGPRPALDPGVVAQGDELKVALDGALAKLSGKHRDVFILYTVRGLSYREIATTLGIQIGTVMSRLFYARKHLQEMLSEFHEGLTGHLGERAQWQH